MTAPFTLREEAVTARTGVTYNSYAHSFAGMGIQFLLFVALDFGIAFLLERQGGLWKRLRAAPLSRSSLLLGKAVAGALVGLISVGATFAFGIAVFGIRIEGSVPGFLLLLVASALMASSFGLLLAALGRTPGTTRGLSILAILLLVMLGGGWVPAFIFPGWLQTVTLVLPTRWAIDGLDAVTWRGAGFLVGALPACGVLLGYAALFLLGRPAPLPLDRRLAQLAFLEQGRERLEARVVLVARPLEGDRLEVGDRRPGLLHARERPLPVLGAAPAHRLPADLHAVAGLARPRAPSA